MKSIFFSIFLLISTLSFGQKFYAYGNLSSRTVGAGLSRNVTITLFNGGYKPYPDANYATTDITTGMVVWINCTRFPITAIVSTSPLVLTVADSMGTGGLDGLDLYGYRLAILEESRVSSYNIAAFTDIADGNAGTAAGLSPKDGACIQNYYGSQLDSAITNIDIPTAVLEITQTSHGYTSADVGKLVYLTGANAVKLANADYGDADSVAQWVISSIVDVNNLELCNSCFVTLPSAHGITQNSYIWLGVTPGSVLDSATLGRNIQFVGKALGTTSMYFQIADIVLGGGGGSGLDSLFLADGTMLANGDTINITAPDVPLAPAINFGGVPTTNVQTALAAIDARLDSASNKTLADISTISTDATKSTYTMTSTIPVHFKSSDANTVLYLDETNETIGVGTIGSTARITAKNIQEPSRATVVATQTFASDTTNWTRGAGWTFPGTVATATAASSDLTYVSALTITSGVAYEVTYTMSGYTAGTFTMKVGNTTYTLPSYDITENVVVLFPTAATGGFRITAAAGTANFDNISVVAISNPSTSLFASQLSSTSVLYNEVVVPNSTSSMSGGGGKYTTGTHNVGNGYQTLYSNTTGTHNVGNGYQALYYNTTGINNVGIGRQALYSNTTGSYNTALGRWPLYSNTTGSYNTANGYLAMYLNTIGSYNIASGYHAGRYIADGITGRKSGDYGIYMGADAKASADGTTNEIVIGYNATGLGSNTVVLGNTSIVTTALRGNVGIGTTSPDRLLHPELADATTNTVTYPVRVSKTTSGTATTGFGLGIEFEQEGADGANDVTARINVVATDATAGTEDEKMTVDLIKAGTLTEALSLTSLGALTPAGRLQQNKGVDVASAGDLTLGTDGNVFHVTGTTTINAIITANWSAGEIILIFDASVTVKNNTAGGAGTAVMSLAGGVDFSATASDVLKLVYDGTMFYEVSRSIN